MALYDQIFLFINGALMAENTSIDTELSSDVQQVMTIVKQFAGITPSPIVRTVTAENVIPLTGFEFDFEQKFIDSEEVEIMLQQGGSGKKTTSKGYFTGVPVSSGVGKTATVSFSFVGTPSAFA